MLSWIHGIHGPFLGIMNEYNMVYLAVFTGFGLVIASFLWALGGRGNKEFRRIGSPVTITLFLSTTLMAMGLWSWFFLLIYPCLMPVVLGYGGDDLLTKAWRRATFSLSNSLLGLLLCLVLGGNAWLVFPLHLLIALSTVYLAVLNPLYAPAEEFFVALLLYVCNFMYPFLVR
jgi:hypothetical protein